MHLPRARRGLVVQSVQMQQPVREIRTQFVFQRGAKLARLSASCLRANENLAMVERDHVGRTKLVEKLSI